MDRIAACPATRYNLPPVQSPTNRAIVSSQCAARPTGLSYRPAWWPACLVVGLVPYVKTQAGCDKRDRAGPRPLRIGPARKKPTMPTNLCYTSGTVTAKAQQGPSRARHGPQTGPPCQRTGHALQARHGPENRPRQRARRARPATPYGGSAGWDWSDCPLRKRYPKLGLGW